MAHVIKADLQRIDSALKAGFGHRSRLRAGSLEAWRACSTSLSDVIIILVRSAFAHPGESAAAMWVHWRKSSTSKQLLSLLQAVIEEVHVLEPSVAWSIRSCAAHFSICIIDFFFMRTRSATLWPSMRAWLVDQGGVQGIWTTLAWSLTCSASTDLVHIRISVRSVLSLTDELRGVHMIASLPQHPGVAGALILLLSEILPRDFAAGNSQLWRLGEFLSSIVCITDASIPPLEADHGGGSSLVLQLHRPLLVAWPYLMAALRQREQQQGLQGAESDVEVGASHTHASERKCTTQLLPSIELCSITDHNSQPE